MRGRAQRLGDAHLWAGFRSAAFRNTGTLVVVLDGIAAGLDTEGGRWQTICDDHGIVCSHPTLALATSHAVEPSGWCEPCAEEATS